MVVGDPKRGLVGIGHGKNESIQLAHQRAFNQAVLNMDAVPRFENRTLYGQGADLRTKWRATTVIMRARPPGFGLQVPHVLHRIFSACGIRDASAQILGSTNKTQVVKAALQIIHGGVSFILPSRGELTAGVATWVGYRQEQGAQGEQGRRHAHAP
jgi:small subunit ribosomal protein S5